MVEQDKHKKIKDIFPILWNSYEHMHNVRETNVINGIHYLIIVATFMPIFCLTLYMVFNKSIFFLFPILFQIVALLILLKKFFIKIEIPWIELENTPKQLDRDVFEVSWFAELKAFENDTNRCRKAFRAIIKEGLALLLSSIFLTALASVFLFMNGEILLYVVIVILIVVFILLFFFCIECDIGNITNERMKSHCNKIESTLFKKEISFLRFIIILITFAFIFEFMNSDIYLFIWTSILLTISWLFYLFYKMSQEPKIETDKKKYMDEIKKWLQ